MGKKLSQAQVIEDFHRVHGDRYDYSKVKYENGGTRVTIGCTKCGVWFPQKPDAHKQGQGCKKCALASNGPSAHKTNSNLIQPTGFVWYDLLLGVIRLAQVDEEGGYDPMKDKAISREDAKKVMPASEFLESIHHIIDLATPSTVINRHGHMVTQ